MPGIFKNDTLVMVKQDFPVCYKALVLGIEISQKITYKNGWSEKHVSGYCSKPDYGMAWSGSSYDEKTNSDESNLSCSGSISSTSASFPHTTSFGLGSSHNSYDKNITSSTTCCYQHKLLEVYFKSKDDAIKFIKTKSYCERCYALIIPIYEGTDERHLKPEEVPCFTWKWNEEKQNNEIKDFVISQEPSSFASDIGMLQSYLHIIPVSKPHGWS